MEQIWNLLIVNLLLLLLIARLYIDFDIYFFKEMINIEQRSTFIDQR